MPSTPQASWVPDLSVFPPYSDPQILPLPSDGLVASAGPEPILENVVATLVAEGSTVPPISWVPGNEATSERTWSGRATRLRIGLHADVDDAAGAIVRASRGYERRDRLGWLAAASTYPVTLLVLEPLCWLGVIAVWPALGVFAGVLAVACFLARMHSRRLDQRLATDVLRLVPIRRPGDRRAAPLLDAVDVSFANRC